MSSTTLKEIHSKRLEFLKGLKPLAPPEKIDSAVEVQAGDVEVLVELPPPANEADVADIRAKFEESEAYINSARTKLSAPNSPASVEWDIGLYVLFTAWIVNFGLDPEAEEAQKAAAAGDFEKASKLLEQSQHLIYQAAEAIELEWIPFVDLALVAFNPEADYPASGPFGGVFIHRGDKPFIVLAYKGTTYSKEVNADAKAFTVLPREGILYGKRVHAGMYQGLFEVFPEMNTYAFDIIWRNLERVAQDLKATSGNPVPVYVTGHSLGAGYADLTYIELVRRLGSTPSSSYNLHDLWIYGAPRVGLDDLAELVRDTLKETGRHLYRPTRFRDLVPTIPNVVLIPGEITTYKHFDGGFKLTPQIRPYVTPRLSEIGLSTTYNDLDAKWEFHWPHKYYEGIKKVLDNA